MATTGIATGTLWLLVSIPSGEPDPAETLGPLERCVGPLCDGEQWLPLVVPPVSKCETPVASGPLSECPLVSSGKPLLWCCLCRNKLSCFATEYALPVGL